MDLRIILCARMLQSQYYMQCYKQCKIDVIKKRRLDCDVDQCRNLCQVSYIEHKSNLQTVVNSSKREIIALL